MAHSLSCTFLPGLCALCGALLCKIDAAPICEACWSEIPERRANCCVRCGEDLFEPIASGTAIHCRACRLAPPAFVRAVSAGVYEGTMRGAIHALKYERMTPVSKQLGRRLARAMAEMAPGAAGMLVVPVPLHRARMRERGFNQARALAGEAIAALAKTHPAWRLELSSKSLVRQRATESQAGLTPRQRRVNLRGAFFVSNADSIRGRDILLVDDIYTTGATARACSRVLVEAGAASVRVATVARAQRRFPLAFRDETKYVRLTLPEGGVQELASSKTLSVH